MVKQKKLIYVLSCIAALVNCLQTMYCTCPSSTGAKECSNPSVKASCAPCKNPPKTTEWLDKLEHGGVSCPLSDDDIACIVKRCVAPGDTSLSYTAKSKANNKSSGAFAHNDLDEKAADTPEVTNRAKDSSDQHQGQFQSSDNLKEKHALQSGTVDSDSVPKTKKTVKSSNTSSEHHDDTKSSSRESHPTAYDQEYSELLKKADHAIDQNKSKPLKSGEWKEDCSRPCVKKPKASVCSGEWKESCDTPCSEKIACKPEPCSEWKEACDTLCGGVVCLDPCDEMVWKETCHGNRVVAEPSCGPLILCEQPRKKKCVNVKSTKCPKKCSSCPTYCPKKCPHPCTTPCAKPCDQVCPVPCEIACPELCPEICPERWQKAETSCVTKSNNGQTAEKKSEEIKDKEEGEKKDDKKKGPKLREGQWQEKWKPDCSGSDLLSYIPCETALLPNKLYVRLNGGVAPSFWTGRGMMQRVFNAPQPALDGAFFQDVIQMPQFRDLYRLPGFTIAGSLGWAADENVELFGEVAYCRNKGIIWPFSFPFFPDNRSGILQINMDSTPYRALAGYVGARYHLGMYFKNTLSFYGGLKIGVLHRRMVLSDFIYTVPNDVIVNFPDVRQPLLRPNAITFPRNTYTSIGLQVGFDIPLPDLLGIYGRLTLGGRLEMIATAGVYPRRTVMDFKDANRVELPTRGFLFGHLGTQFTFPASLVLSVEFDIDEVLGGFKYCASKEEK